MGFYAPAQLLRDLREHGGKILPVDVNHSCWDVTLEQHGANSPEKSPARFPVRLGFRLIVGFAQRHATAIERAREAGPFMSIDDFARRTGLSRAVIKQLSDADAFQSTGRNRRAALWQTLAQDKSPRETPLFAGLVDDEDDSELKLPAMHPIDEVFHDYAATGLSLKAHPISFYREQLDKLGIVANERLASFRTDRRVRVAGLVLMRQRPSTAKGITFVTLEDETGIANLVIHQNTWNRFYAIARRGTAWIAHGRVENKYSVIHVVVDRLENLAERLKALHAPSRDFR